MTFQNQVTAFSVRKPKKKNIIITSITSKKLANKKKMPIAMQQELENHSLVTNNSHATHNLHHIQASKKSIKSIKNKHSNNPTSKGGELCVCGYEA